MKNDVMLSVIIISYNQKKYIKDAIESVINQKTNYKYEIILADDCSPDGTGKICEDYAKKYPKLIKNLKREKNLGATTNSFTACCKAKGKYIAILEGDDYWCNENKLQIQIDFLESHAEYIAVSHLQKGISEGNQNIGLFPSWVKRDCDVNMNDFLNEKLFSETSSIFKNIYLDDKLKNDIQQLASFSREVGDYQKCILLLSLGKVRVINEAMMVYRAFHNSNNYNSRYNLEEICIQHIEITKRLDNFFQSKYCFFPKYSRYFSLALSYEILHFNFENLGKIVSQIPKKHRLKIYILYPLTMIKIILIKLIK